MKNKVWKRATALGLSALMAAGNMTCVTASAAEEEPVKIEWLAYNCYGQPDEDSEVIKAIEEKFNVDFEFWYVDNQKWDEVLGAKLSSGDMPDIMKITNSNNIPTYVKQGIAAEITDEMMEKMPTFVEQMNKADLDGNSFIDTYYEGKRYAFKSPVLNGVYPTILVWRTDWLKNVGIDKMPATIDEVEAAVYAFRNDDPDGNGVKDTYGMSETAMSAVFGAYGAIPLAHFSGNGGEHLYYTEKDGRVEFACTQPEMKDALAKVQQWYKDGVIDPEFITGENTGGYWAVSQAFENEKIGVTGQVLSTHWNPPFVEGNSGGACYEEFMSLHPDAKFGETFDLGPAIEGPNGAIGTPCWGAYGANGYVLTTKCMEDQRKVDKILEIIEAFSSDYEFAKLATYGFEGVHHEVTDEGGFKFIEPYGNVSEGNKAGLSVIALGVNEELAKGGGKKMEYDWYEKYNTPGYVDIMVPATESANRYLTDLNTFALDAYIKIITGVESVDYFDTFVEEFNAMGGEEIINDINNLIAENTK